jgi:hypothetical protein
VRFNYAGQGERFLYKYTKPDQCLVKTKKGVRRPRTRTESVAGLSCTLEHEEVVYLAIQILGYPCITMTVGFLVVVLSLGWATASPGVPGGGA